jgi:hypothetical protein
VTRDTKPAIIVIITIVAMSLVFIKNFTITLYIKIFDFYDQTFEWSRSKALALVTLIILVIKKIVRRGLIKADLLALFTFDLYPVRHLSNLTNICNGTKKYLLLLDCNQLNNLQKAIFI